MFDHRKYMSPTGRIPRDPEMQFPRTSRPRPQHPIVQTDFSQVELRVLAQMDAEGQAANQVFGFEHHESQASVTTKGDE